MPKAAVGLCRYFERHIQNTYLVCIMNVGILNVATLILIHFDRALFIVIFLVFWTPLFGILNLSFGILNPPFWYFEFWYFEFWYFETHPWGHLWFYNYPGGPRSPQVFGPLAPAPPLAGPGISSWWSLAWVSLTPSFLSARPAGCPPRPSPASPPSLSRQPLSVCGCCCEPPDWWCWNCGIQRMPLLQPSHTVPPGRCRRWCNHWASSLGWPHQSICVLVISKRLSRSLRTKRANETIAVYYLFFTGLPNRSWPTCPSVLTTFPRRFYGFTPVFLTHLPHFHFLSDPCAHGVRSLGSNVTHSLTHSQTFVDLEALVKDPCKQWKQCKQS